MQAMKYYLNLKRKKILPYVSRMKLEFLTLSETSQSEKDRYCKPQIFEPSIVMRLTEAESPKMVVTG